MVRGGREGPAPGRGAPVQPARHRGPAPQVISQPPPGFLPGPGAVAQAPHGTPDACLWDNDSARWVWRAQPPPSERALQAHARDLQCLRAAHRCRCLLICDAAWQRVTVAATGPRAVLDALGCVPVPPPLVFNEGLQHTLWRVEHGLVGACPPGVHTLVIATGNGSIAQRTPEQIVDGLLQLSEAAARAANARQRRDPDAGPLQILLYGLLPWPLARGLAPEHVATLNDRVQEVNRLIPRRQVSGDLHVWPQIQTLDDLGLFFLTHPDRWASMSDESLRHVGVLRANPAVFDLECPTPTLGSRGAAAWAKQLAGELSELWPGRNPPPLAGPLAALERPEQQAKDANARAGGYAAAAALGVSAGAPSGAGVVVTGLHTSPLAAPVPQCGALLLLSRDDPASLRTIDEEARQSQARKQLAAQLRVHAADELRARDQVMHKRQSDLEIFTASAAASLKAATEATEARELDEALRLQLPADEEGARTGITAAESRARRRVLSQEEEVLRNDVDTAADAAWDAAYAAAAAAHAELLHRIALRKCAASEARARVQVGAAEDRGHADLLRRHQAAIAAERKRMADELRRAQHEEQCARTEALRAEEAARREKRALLQELEAAYEAWRRDHADARRRIERDETAGRAPTVKEERQERAGLAAGLRQPEEQRAERERVICQESEEREAVELRARGGLLDCKQAADQALELRRRRRAEAQKQVGKDEGRGRTKMVAEEQQERQRLREAGQLQGQAATGMLKAKEAKRITSEESSARQSIAALENDIRAQPCNVIQSMLQAMQDVPKYARHDFCPRARDRVRPARRLVLGQVTLRLDKEEEDQRGECFIPPTAVGDVVLASKDKSEYGVKWDRGAWVQLATGGAPIDCDTNKAAREAAIRLIHKQKPSDVPAAKRWSITVAARDLAGVPWLELALPRQLRLGLHFVDDHPADGRMVVDRCEEGGAADFAGASVLRGWQLSHINNRGPLTCLREARDAVQRHVQGAAKNSVYLRFHPIVTEAEAEALEALAEDQPGSPSTAGRSGEGGEAVEPRKHGCPHCGRPPGEKDDDERREGSAGSGAEGGEAEQPSADQ
eukprot:TRINITY_DN3040_c0_g1_i1.p1 TRINITY_DN3040_c0_g1~~TRINITY_DN3040_c0_g1_i1.p1  ORF type:complete len:1082 (+),score=325.60 TRINITY_DN3040_c0_g1_i1:93-3338(+)